LLPFFALGLALAFNTALMERTRVGAIGADWSFSPAERILIAGHAVWFYLQKLLWPVNLTFIYPRWEISSTSLAQWLFPVSAAAVLVCLWLARHRIGRGPLVAALFFGGTLLPALGFVNVYPMRFSFVADHFQYLAMIGPIALIAALLSQNRVVERSAFVLPLLLGALTWRQTLVYRDLETLWTDTIAKNPAAWLAHNNLGNVLLDRGDVHGAIARYREATTLKPDYYEAQGNLGSALLRVGAVEEARGSIDAALRVAPDFTPALVTRAAILSNCGTNPTTAKHSTSSERFSRPWATWGMPRRRLRLPSRFGRIWDRLASILRACCFEQGKLTLRQPRSNWRSSSHPVTSMRST
jgi:tetratricopeptide (TPR) repeat protein